ncbi:GNAT family N-acetyltransferase [Spirillospora sp. NPDC127200]
MGDIYVRAWRQAFADLYPQDLLASLDAETEAPAWRPLLRSEAWPGAGALLAETDQGTVGFAGFASSDLDTGTAELQTLYVLPEAWGTGIGRLLMTAALGAMRQAGYRAATLWVLEANDRARRFHRAARWRPDATVVDDTTAGITSAKQRYRISLEAGSANARPTPM